MASNNLSEHDEYGFKRRDIGTIERAMSGYIGVLGRREMRWEQYLKKDPDLKEMNRTLKRFIRKGVPLKYRKRVWLKTSGAYAAQQAEPNLYADLLRMPRDSEIADSIKIDLPRTYPNNILFETYHQQLFNVLMAFSNYNRRIGYCQGLNYVAGMLLLVCKEEEVTFWLLKHLIQEVTPDYHIKTMAGLIQDIGVMAQLIRTHVPEVYDHVHKTIGLSWTVILTKWFICLFAEVLPTETVFRIWDCIFSEGNKIIFRVALTLLILFRKEIVATEDILELSNMFKAMVCSEQATDCHSFLSLVFKTTKFVKRAEIERLRKVVGQSALD